MILAKNQGESLHFLVTFQSSQRFKKSFQNLSFLNLPKAIFSLKIIWYSVEDTHSNGTNNLKNHKF